MSAGPLVTIVIPTWNRAALVQEAIASVAAQTYPNWEAIVVDDGSSDETAAAVAALNMERVRIVALDHTGNAARARNRGVAKGSGEWVAFLDSDDRWLPRKLERQLAAVKSSGAGWCYAAFGHIDAAGEPIPARAGRFRAIAGPILPALLREDTAAYIGTLLIERTLFDEVGGFDESLLLRADLDLALRLAAAAEAAVVDEEVMQVRVHGARLTIGAADPHAATARVFRRWLERERDPQVRALARKRYAQVLTEGLRYKLRRREWLAVLRTLPRAIAARLRR